MKEIANNEDYEWIVAIMAIDDYESFCFASGNSKEVVTKEIDKMEKEMYHLFDIYGNGNINGKNKGAMKYFGYKLARIAEYGLILYDSKDRNKCFIPGHEIVETLKEEISMKCQFTVSVGSARLIEDDLGMTDDWYERINANLKQAQKNGGNCACFGIGGDGIELDDEDSDDIVGIRQEDNEIKKRSLQMIDVCIFCFVFRSFYVSIFCLT